MLIITEDSVQVCDHKGTVSNKPSQDWVTIAGRRILVETDPESRTISKCPNSNFAAGQKPCVRTLKVQKGYSELIRIGGKRACLDTINGLTDGTPPGEVHYFVLHPGQEWVSEAG